jgi:hypothetical protein
MSLRRSGGRTGGQKKSKKRLKSLITLAFEVAKDSFGFYEDLRFKKISMKHRGISAGICLDY